MLLKTLLACVMILGLTAGAWWWLDRPPQVDAAPSEPLWTACPPAPPAEELEPEEDDGSWADRTEAEEAPEPTQEAQLRPLLALPPDELVNRHLSAWWSDSPDRVLLVPALHALDVQPQPRLVDALVQRLRRPGAQVDPPAVAAFIHLDRQRALTELPTILGGRSEHQHTLAALRRFPTEAALVERLAALGLVAPTLDGAGLLNVEDALLRDGRLARIDVEDGLNLEQVVHRLTRLVRPSLDAVQLTVDFPAAVTLELNGQCRRFPIATREDYFDLQAVLDALNAALAQVGAQRRLAALPGGQVFRCVSGPPSAFALLAQEGLLEAPAPVVVDFGKHLDLDRRAVDEVIRR